MFRSSEGSIRPILISANQHMIRNWPARFCSCLGTVQPASTMTASGIH